MSNESNAATGAIERHASTLPAAAAPARPPTRRVIRIRRPKRSGPGFSLRDVVFVLFRHKAKALAAAITLFTLCLMAALLLPSRYRSEARIEVRYAPELIRLDPSSSLGERVMVTTDFDKQVNTEAEILRSRVVASETIGRLGIEYFEPSAPTDPDKLASVENDWAALISERVQVATVKGSQVLAVAYEAKSPEQARDIVDAYVRSYLRVRAETRSNPRSLAILEQQGAQARERFQAIQDQLLKLKQSTQVSDPVEQKKILLGRLAAQQGQIDATNAAVSASVKTVETLERELELTPREIRTEVTTGAATSSLDDLRSRVTQLKLQEAELLSKYLPTSIPVQQVRDQIAAAEKTLAEAEQGDGGREVKMGMNPVHIELEGRLKSERASLEGSEAKLATLARDLKSAQEALASLDRIDSEMRQLSIDAGVAEDWIRKLAQGREVARADDTRSSDNDAGGVAIVQPASLPDSPSSPNRKLLLVFGVLLGMFGGLASAFVAEALDQTICRPNDLRRLGVGRVVSIPAMSITRTRAEDATRVSPAGALVDDPRAMIELAEHAVGAPAVPPSSLRPTRYVRSTERSGVQIAASRAGTENLSPREILERWREQRPVDAPAEASAESMPSNGETPPADSESPVRASAAMPAINGRLLDAAHAILERFVFAAVAGGQMPMPSSIAVVSVSPGDGGSTVAAHLATAMTDYLPPPADDEPSGRVMLVDGDLADPMAHSIFDVENHPGIAEWISGMQHPQMLLGDLVRPTPIARLDLLSAGDAARGHQPGRWVDAVSMALQSRYHTVVVDLPSMARCEATARVAGMCDAAVLVVECGKSNREVVRQAIHRLEESGVRLLGVVLNKRTYPIPEKLYRWI